MILKYDMLGRLLVAKKVLGKNLPIYYPPKMRSIL
jgi:hypothetical protein